MPRALLVAVALALAGCAGGGEPGGTAATTAPTPAPSRSVVINPPGVRVENAALGRSKVRVRRAIRDLKAADLWKPLTRHLYRIKFGSRLGLVNVPEDGHLADAVLTAAFDRHAQGRLCDVMLFPNAIARDLERWRTYWARGALADPPPSLRAFWASIVAHELGHCFPGGPGEKVARSWERRALRAVLDLKA